jgi:acetyltransferase-like isoleucine patch superfamily enzyme
MSLCLAKVPPALGERIAADPALLDQLWPVADDDESAAAPDAQIAAIDHDRDTLFEDYLGISHEIDEEPARYPWMRRALEGTGTEIGYDLGYGNGFRVTAQEAARIADGLAREGWWSPGQEVALISHAIAAFYRSAADEGRTVIGAVA